MDLRGLHRPTVPKHSTALTKLDLFRCKIDEPTISAILSVPFALEALHLTLALPSSYRTSDPRDLPFFQDLLTELACQQPGVKALDLDMRCFRIPDPKQSKNSVDFAQLTSLKRLHLHDTTSFAIHGVFSDDNQSLLAIRHCCKFPIGLERLKVGSGSWISVEWHRCVHRGIPELSSSSTSA